MTAPTSNNLLEIMTKNSTFTVWAILVTIAATMLGLTNPHGLSVVEASTGNLSLAGKISASSSRSAHNASKAKDGNLDTYWIADDFSMPQWLKVDLGKLYTLNKVDQSFAQLNTWKFVIEGSIDDQNWVTLVDRSFGASGQHFSNSVNGTFRYVRLTVTFSASNLTASSKQFSIFGTDEGGNIAAGKTALASSSLVNYEVGKGADGNTSTYWCANDETFPQTMTVDLGSDSLISAVKQNFLDFDTWKFEIEGSRDNASWTPLMDKSAGIQGQSFKQNVAGTYRYVRLTVLGSAAGRWANSSELNVYGFENLAQGDQASDAVAANPSAPLASPAAVAPRFLTVDLGGLSDLKKVEQSFVDDGSRTFVVEGSKDDVKWTKLTDETSITGKLFSRDVAGTYRYIRSTAIDAAAGARPENLKVFGTAISRDLARGVSATSSSLEAGHEPFNAVDGDDASYWRADGATMPQRLTVDLGNNGLLDRIEQSFVHDDTRKFVIEGSADGAKWTMLMDKSAGATGKSFGQSVNGSYRYVRLTVTHSAAGQRAESQALKVFGIGSPVTTKWWENSGAVFRYYPKYFPQTFNSIVSELDDLKSKGYQAIELLTPTQGPADIWAGLGATDNFAVDPVLGTMADFENLIATAHSKGMKIVFFGNAGYARDTAPFFAKAQDDQRNDVYSPERMWFHFSSTKPDDHWHWSERANAYYYAYWDSHLPSYNYNTKEWQEESQRYLRFWLDKGVDGFVLDAPGNYDGFQGDNGKIRNNANITDVLRNYDVSTGPEGAHGDFSDVVVQWHYTTMQDYSITEWGGGGHSAIINAINARNPNSLESSIFKPYRDKTNAVGGVTQTPPSWEIADVPTSKRLLEVATLATFGTLFYLHNGAQDIRPQISEIPTWTTVEQTTLWSLLRAQASYKALAPAGLRVKLPTNDDDKFYAFKRTNKTGDSKALVVLNYQNSSQTITVNLTNTDIDTTQIPIDLLSGGNGKAIASDSYTVTLPAYGFTVLGVN